MKMLIIAFLLSISHSLVAQKTIFVHVYDLTGKKITKGRVLAVTDTSLQLVGQPTRFSTPVRDIGIIRTKRSGGHNVLIGSVVGLLTMAVVGAASSNPDAGYFASSAGAGAAGGAIVGLPIGAAIGALTILFKRSRLYLITGDVTKWKAFQVTVRESRY